jgi:hypothetical protein
VELELVGVDEAPVEAVAVLVLDGLACGEASCAVPAVQVEPTTPATIRRTTMGPSIRVSFCFVKFFTISGLLRMAPKPFG